MKKKTSRIILLAYLAGSISAHASLLRTLDGIDTQIDFLSKCVKHYLMQESQAVEVSGQSVLRNNIIAAMTGVNQGVHQECANIIASATNDPNGVIKVVTLDRNSSVLPALANQTFYFTPNISDGPWSLNSQSNARIITSYACLYKPGNVDLTKFQVAGSSRNLLASSDIFLPC